MFTKKIKISVFVSIALFVFTLGLSTVNAVSVITIENSSYLCHDGIDNDDNGSTDMADVSCANFATDTSLPILIPEDSYALCHNSKDDDDNGSTDMADVSCANFATDTATTTVITEPTTSGGGSSSGGRRRSPVANLANSQGQVLGATTDIADATCAIRTTFLKRGFANNPEEVRKLQTFLNTEMNSGLPITGFFGPLTEQAVDNFQVKYSTEILLPWFNLGLNPTPTSPTGYVYKTTLYKINSILCPNTILVYPVLN